MIHCPNWDFYIAHDRLFGHFENKEKSFQIILPSDVDIALASVYCLGATKSVLRRRRREQRSLVNCLRLGRKAVKTGVVPVSR